jgi:hypothetical protein
MNQSNAICNDYLYCFAFAFDFAFNFYNTLKRDGLKEVQYIRKLLKKSRE